MCDPGLEGEPWRCVSAMVIQWHVPGVDVESCDGRVSVLSAYVRVNVALFFHWPSPSLSLSHFLSCSLSISIGSTGVEIYHRLSVVDNIPHFVKLPDRVQKREVSMFVFVIMATRQPPPQLLPWMHLFAGDGGEFCQEVWSDTWPSNGLGHHRETKSILEGYWYTCRILLYMYMYVDTIVQPDKKWKTLKTSIVYIECYCYCVEWIIWYLLKARLLWVGR